MLLVSELFYMSVRNAVYTIDTIFYVCVDHHPTSSLVEMDSCDGKKWHGNQSQRNQFLSALNKTRLRSITSKDLYGTLNVFFYGKLRMAYRFF